MYLDVKSLVSTGVGILLDADDMNDLGSNPHLLPGDFTQLVFDPTLSRNREEQLALNMRSGTFRIFLKLAHSVTVACGPEQEL